MAAPPKLKPYGKTPMGDRVFKARQELGHTQEEFAKRCHLSRLHYRAIEEGKNKLTSLEARGKLARGFDVAVEVMSGYLEGRVTLKAFMAQRGAGHRFNELQLRRLEERRIALGVHESVVDNLAADTSLGADMKKLPDQVRRAVMGFVHVYSMPVDRVAVVALQLLDHHNPDGEDQAHPSFWYELLRKRLEHEAESGLRPTPKRIKITGQEEP